jgi:hypothetical protein
LHSPGSCRQLPGRKASSSAGISPFSNVAPTRNFSMIVDFSLSGKWKTLSQIFSHDPHWIHASRSIVIFISASGIISPCLLIIHHIFYQYKYLHLISTWRKYSVKERIVRVLALQATASVIVSNIVPLFKWEAEEDLGGGEEDSRK